MYNIAKAGGNFDWGQRWDKMPKEKMMDMVKEVGRREAVENTKLAAGGYQNDAAFDKEIQIIFKIYKKLKQELMKKGVSKDDIEEQHGGI